MSILFKQERIGKHGRPFILYKFRTMREGNGSISTSANDERITKIGKFLRKTKLDELPQLINIVKGDMLLVGPRPTLKEVTDTLTQEERDIILSVKPGITDYASIWNSNEEERLANQENPHQYFMDNIYPEIVRLQIKYIKEKSFKTDVKILWQTTTKLLGRHD